MTDVEMSRKLVWSLLPFFRDEEMEHLRGLLSISKVPGHSEILGKGQAARLWTLFPETIMEPCGDVPVSIHCAPVCCSWPVALLILTGCHMSEALWTVGGLSWPRAQWTWWTSFISSLHWPYHDWNHRIGQCKPHSQAPIGTEDTAVYHECNGSIHQNEGRGTNTLYRLHSEEDERNQIKPHYAMLALTCNLWSHLPFWGTFATFNKSTEIHHLAELREVLNFKSGHYLLKLGSPCW